MQFPIIPDEWDQKIYPLYYVPLRVVQVPPIISCYNVRTTSQHTSVRADIGKYVVTWLKHSRGSNRPLPGPIADTYPLYASYCSYCNELPLLWYWILWSLYMQTEWLPANRVTGYRNVLSFPVTLVTDGMTICLMTWYSGRLVWDKSPA